MRTLFTILMLGLTAGSAQASAASQHRCYAWSDAAPIVQRENLMSAHAMQQQARKRLDGDLLRITLCEEDGQFVYKLIVQEGGGKVKNVTVRAKEPF